MKMKKTSWNIPSDVCLYADSLMPSVEKIISRVEIEVTLGLMDKKDFATQLEFHGLPNSITVVSEFAGVFEWFAAEIHAAGYEVAHQCYCLTTDEPKPKFCSIVYDIQIRKPSDAKALRQAPSLGNFIFREFVFLPDRPKGKASKVAKRADISEKKINA